MQRETRALCTGISPIYPLPLPYPFRKSYTQPFLSCPKAQIYKFTPDHANKPAKKKRNPSKAESKNIHSSTPRHDALPAPLPLRSPRSSASDIQNSVFFRIPGSSGISLPSLLLKLGLFLELSMQVSRAERPRSPAGSRSLRDNCCAERECSPLSLEA